jgi:hypothetical protein
MLRVYKNGRKLLFLPDKQERFALRDREADAASGNAMVF